MTPQVVDVNENLYAPYFSDFAVRGSVKENSRAGTSVLAVSAQDDDQGRDGVLRYSISGGSGLGTFSIDEETGVTQDQCLRPIYVECKSNCSQCYAWNIKIPIWCLFFGDNKQSKMFFAALGQFIWVPTRLLPLSSLLPSLRAINQLCYLYRATSC